MGVVVEIATGVRQLGISQQSAQRAAFGGLAKHPVDLGGGGVAGSLQGDVQRRDVHRGHAYGFGLDAPGKFRQQAFDAARQTGGHRDHRLERRTGTAQVLMVVGVDHRLVVHRRVDGGDRHVFQADRLVQQLEQRHPAIGRAGGVGDQRFAAAEVLLVDPIDDGGVDVRLARHRLREQHPRRAGAEETLGLGAIGVLAGALQHQVDPQRLPVDGLRSRAAQHLHAIAVDVQAVAVDLHFAGKAAMGGVEAGQVLDAGLVGQVVQRDDLEAQLLRALVQRAQDAAADTAIAIERDAKRRGGHRQG